jgi:hypothetical protein
VADGTGKPSKRTEGGFVMAAPHRILYANGAWTADAFHDPDESRTKYGDNGMYAMYAT